MHQLGPVNPASTPIQRQGHAQAVHGRAHSAHWRRVAAAVAVSQLAPWPCRKPAWPCCRSRARPHVCRSCHTPLSRVSRVRLPAARLPHAHASARSLSTRSRPSTCCTLSQGLSPAPCRSAPAAVSQALLRAAGRVVDLAVPCLATQCPALP